MDGAFQKAETPKQGQVSFFCALADLKRVKNRRGARVWGNIQPLFHLPASSPALGRRRLWLGGTPNVSSPTILPHTRRKDNLNE